MKRKPRIEYYWSEGKRALPAPGMNSKPPAPVVNVRIFAANGEQVGQITQGFKEKRDARRGVNALAGVFLLGMPRAEDDVLDLVENGFVREIGPGPKPK